MIRIHKVKEGWRVSVKRKPRLILKHHEKCLYEAFGDGKWVCGERSYMAHGFDVYTLEGRLIAWARGAKFLPTDFWMSQPMPDQAVAMKALSFAVDKAG